MCRVLVVTKALPARLATRVVRVLVVMMEFLALMAAMARRAHVVMLVARLPLVLRVSAA